MTAKSQRRTLSARKAGFLMAMQTVEWDRSALMAPFVGGMTYVLICPQ